MPDMITKYSGIFTRRSPKSIDGDPENTKIIMVENDGTEKVIFEGKKYSEDKYQERLEQWNKALTSSI